MRSFDESFIRVIDEINETHETKEIDRKK